MLYKKNTGKLSRELFENPTAEYRATPFWAWNCDLRQELLDEEIDYMKDMGFGGFHMHCRVGMSTPYLSDGFMQLINGSIKKGEENEMLAWLYDEDKWPSGFAGGYVTKNPEFRQKTLIFSKKRADGTLLARYSVELDKDGCLKNYSRDDSGEWYAVLQTAKDSNWHNKQAYVDTMSKAAIDEFIRVTHERYKECCGEKFGGTVPAIFTDEPQVSHKKCFGKASGDRDAELPFTTDFPDTFKAAYGEDLLDKLPELFWELPDGKVSLTRYHYHDHVAERFASAFADNIGSWCEKNGIYLTGHMMEEPTLRSQNAAVGDCMRSYRGFGLPGMDLLCDSIELTTAKQVQSAVRQYGREGALSELYGVTGWDFDFRRHVMQGNWQAALGVTVRVPHLYWVSMKGEAKRDYPASIGHQSPWYKEYKYVEDHFARLNTCLTRGTPVVRVGVIHPIESYWLAYGPDEQTAAKRDELNSRFCVLPEWLLYGLIDYDYINEANLPQQRNGINVGKMKYDTVIVPACDTLRSSTLAYLKDLAAAGGKVIFAGGVPALLDAAPSDEVKRFAETQTVIGWSKYEILSAVEENRLIDIRNDRGERSDNLIYQLRDDDGGLWCFVCNVRNRGDFFKSGACGYVFTFKGEYAPEQWDTFTGTVKPLHADYIGGDTAVQLDLYPNDSVLFRLTPGRSNAEKEEKAKVEFKAYLPETAEISLEEPNVLLLDTPEFSVDGGEWREKLEIIRICDLVKEELGLGNAVAEKCQPWVLGEVSEDHNVSLRYEFYSEIEYDSASLALEDADRTAVTFNGEAVDMSPTGIFIDSCLTTVKLGRIVKGRNVLVLSRPFGTASCLESVFVLGDFGVRAEGLRLTVTPPVRTLPFGDQTRYGLPFYGGNVNYKVKAVCGGRLRLRVPHFKQPLCAVKVDGKDVGRIVLAPFEVDLGELPEGEHEIEIKAFGNRYNTFGALHMNDDDTRWFGPDGWRRDGATFDVGYNLHPAGILVPPMLMEEV